MKGTAVTDSVYQQIRDRIACHAPERGGALYGPRDVPFVTHFEFDAEGATTAVSYVPSSRLIANVPKVERETGLEFKGVVHSHPWGVTRPSGGDERTVAAFFRLNPHFATMELPIVQQAKGDQEFIHWYRVKRRGNTTLNLPWRQADVDVEVIAESFHVLPLLAHVRQIVERLGLTGFLLEIDERVQTLQVRNACFVGLFASSPDGRELMYYVSVDYPIVPPLVLFRACRRTEQLLFRWGGLQDDFGPDLQAIAVLLEQSWKSAGAQAAPATPSTLDPTPDLDFVCANGPATAETGDIHATDRPEQAP